ncbi:MAG: DUF6364 family protein, partial [Tannerellaceae bacterium]|nr:DUF6364 family protein [Tannerellaceae bacterium]
METIILNLPVEKTIAERIKKYAHSRKTSVAQIAENFFATLTASSIDSEDEEISPLVKSFSIDDVNIPVDFDYKKALE